MSNEKRFNPTSIDAREKEEAIKKLKKDRFKIKHESEIFAKRIMASETDKSVQYK